METRQIDIQTVIEQFVSKSNPEDRFTSFDYCYNYFRAAKSNELTQDIEKSCLTLGFYLASWGMLRGSSFLLGKSAKYFQPTIEYISELDKSVWYIDIDTYNDDNIQEIIKIYSNIKGTLIKGKNTDLTLITKVLLGVFGFVPAFDQYFCDTFRSIFKDYDCGFRKLNTKSLKYIKIFYENNKIEIDNISNNTFTTDFITGQKTAINYPKAKIIDMYGFTVRA